MARTCPKTRRLSYAGQPENAEATQMKHTHMLRPNARLLVTLLPETEEEREAWLHLSAQKLTEAYSDDELKYPLSAVREMNPNV